MNDLVLIPYIEIDGAWTIPEEAMMGIYRLMVKEETATAVFCSGAVKTETDFVAACQSKGTYTVVILKNDGQPAAIIWLKDFCLNHAYGHFCFFKSVWGKQTIDAGRMALDHFFHFARPDGKGLLHVLIGVFPGKNKKALEFVRKLGFTIVGTIPKMIYDEQEDKMVDAVFSYVERG
ncbi:MAG: GNAT family N-acetyltransferase [Desulfuromonadaceae bacterium]